MRCLSVCLSVTFVSCGKTNKYIIKIFSPSGSHAILVFSNIQTGTPPNGGVEYKWGYEKIAIFDQYLALSLK